MSHIADSCRYGYHFCILMVDKASKVGCSQIAFMLSSCQCLSLRQFYGDHLDYHHIWFWLAVFFHSCFFIFRLKLVGNKVWFTQQTLSWIVYRYNALQLVSLPYITCIKVFSVSMRTHKVQKFACLSLIQNSPNAVGIKVLSTSAYLSIIIAVIFF